MIGENMFYGLPMSDWIEIKRQIDRRPDGFEVLDLINQLANFRAKVSYYEEMMQRMQTFKDSVK